MTIPPKPKMSPAEFVDAVTELSKRTGKSPVLLAERLSSNVVIEEPEPDLSRLNLRAYCHDVAQLTATAGCTVSQALSQLRLEDYDGVR